MQWLVLWATLQCGFVPVSVDGPIVMNNIGYVEPGFGATMFNFLTIEGSIRTYVTYLNAQSGFWPLRDTYSIGARIDPTPWLRVGALHWCLHADAPFKQIKWEGDQAQTEIYIRLKLGG